MERCTDAEDAGIHLENLKSKLLDRKYPEEVLKKQIKRAKRMDRKSQIYKNKPSNLADNKVRLIFTYNQNNPPIHKWIKQSRKYLDRNEKAKELGKNIQIAYRQPQNIKKLVGGPSGCWSEGMVSEKDPGCSKCAKKCHVRYN